MRSVRQNRIYLVLDFLAASCLGFFYFGIIMNGVSNGYSWDLSDQDIAYVVHVPLFQETMIALFAFAVLFSIGIFYRNQILLFSSVAALVLFVSIVVVNAPVGYNNWYYGYIMNVHPPGTVTPGLLHVSVSVFLSFVVGMVALCTRLALTGGVVIGSVLTFAIGSAWLYYFEYLIWPEAGRGFLSYKYVGRWAVYLDLPPFTKLTNIDLFMGAAVATYAGIGACMALAYYRRSSFPDRRMIFGTAAFLISCAVLEAISLEISYVVLHMPPPVPPGYHIIIHHVRG